MGADSGYIADLYRDGEMVFEGMHLANIYLLKVNASRLEGRSADGARRSFANSMRIYKARADGSRGKWHGAYEKRGLAWRKLPEDSMGTTSERLERLHQRQREKACYEYGAAREASGKQRRKLEEMLADFADYYESGTGTRIPREYIEGFASEYVPEPEAPSGAEK